VHEHAKIALTSGSGCDGVLSAPQSSFPLVLSFEGESFSCAVVRSTPCVAEPAQEASLSISFFAPAAALEVAVPGAQFTFFFPPQCRGHGVVLEVLGA
jgi:hypothetical protein